MSASSASTIASRFSPQMSGQIPGWPDAMRVMSRKPPAARRSSAACSSARSSATPMSVAAVRCGTWDTTATSASWRSGGERDDLGPERRHDRGDLACRRRRRCRRRREHPDGALEQVGVGAVDAVLLRAGHRVAADEAGVGDGLDDRRLHAADVGHDAPAGVERGLDAPSATDADRRRDERDRRVGVEADRVDRAELERLRGDRRDRASMPSDVPAPLRAAPGRWSRR